MRLEKTPTFSSYALTSTKTLRSVHGLCRKKLSLILLRLRLYQSNQWQGLLTAKGGQLCKYTWGNKNTIPYSVILDGNGIVVYRSTSKYDWEKLENPICRLIQVLNE